MGVFHGYQIALELSSFVPLKKKQELRKLITSNDGVVSFIVTKKCKLLVTLDDEEKVKDSFKCRTALKYNIPVVESRYLYDCVQTGHLVDPDPYVLLGNTKNQLLNAGVIAAPQGKAGAGKTKKRLVLFNLNGIKVWTQSDKNAPLFPDDSYEIAKSIQLTKQEKKLFFIAEVHVAMASSDFKYRIFTHSGELPTQTTDPDVEIGKKEYRYTNSADECLAIYARICQIQVDISNGFTKHREYLGRNIGSKKFQQNQLELLVNTRGPDREVSELVEHIWKEAMGELENVLSVSIDNITVEQVEKAESVLLELKRLLDESMDSDVKKTKLNMLSDEFYSHLAHSPGHQVSINSKHIIAMKQELCQVIRDMVSVSEGTGWSRRCPTEAKYRSLRCHMTCLQETNPDYERIKNLVLNSQKGNLAVTVDSIFEVSRSVEDLAFAAKLENKQLLFHSSRVHNFVGILSRGLLLPKVVVDDLGMTRTDAGMLGSGIYFADDASTSAKYSQPSMCKGSRLMLISDVALGRCLDLFEHNTELHGPPEGYDSVHGVKTSTDIKSQFKDDEYAIYRTNQQRLRYLVEFRMRTDILKAPEENHLKETTETHIGVKPGKISAKTVELNDIQNIPDPLSSVKAGLVSDSDAPVPLIAVHVKARLIDLAAQVIVLQHYRSEYNAPIEAKYVFPLDEMAAVCGFEAFINDKHIVGVVKEKETAHREYREAISQGHGAYLMDQDVETPDVFTVSVGNLPPFCDVLIKITYVAELQMEGEKVSFRIPACVAPWKKSAGLGTVTQGDLDTVKVTKDQVETSIQVAIEMPFEIKQIECPTHRIRLKKTETKAVVEMRKNQPLDEGFQLLISLAEIHVPRMWVEQLPDNPESRACMLTFYPEFEASVSEGFEVIFLLDLSNSMKGSSLTEAKKILLLALHLLPESCYFNVIIFGTDYDELFPCSRTKTPVNTKLAEKFIKSQEAIMGNTEVIRPLSSLFLVCPEDSIQNLFLVSDGHISNEQTTLEAIRTNAGHSRVFTFGVGSVANQHTLRNLSRAGCGYYEFFNSKMKSRWETKIRSQLAKAAQPSLSSICVQWRNFNDAEPAVQAPAEIMALFNGCRQVVYGFVPDCTQATLKAVIDNQEVSTMVSTAELNITTGKILHQLTARAVIQDWNDGQLAAERLEHEILKKNRKNYIIKLSMEFSIITQFTSFVAIEKREKDEVVTATRDLSELVAKDSVDILDYMGWENITCRVNVKTLSHPPFVLELNLNDTIESVKSKISDVTSDHRELILSLFDEPVSGDSILWDQKIEDGATVYGILDEDEIETGFNQDGDISEFDKLLGEYADLRSQGVELRTEDSVRAMEKLLEELYVELNDLKNRRPRRTRCTRMARAKADDFVNLDDTTDTSSEEQDVAQSYSENAIDYSMFGLPRSMILAPDLGEELPSEDRILCSRPKADFTTSRYEELCLAMDDLEADYRYMSTSTSMTKRKPFAAGLREEISSQNAQMDRLMPEAEEVYNDQMKEMSVKRDDSAISRGVCDEEEDEDMGFGLFNSSSSDESCPVTDHRATEHKMSASMTNLKTLAAALGEEISSKNAQIDRLLSKAETSYAVYSGQMRGVPKTPEPPAEPQFRSKSLGKKHMLSFEEGKQDVAVKVVVAEPVGLAEELSLVERREPLQKNLASCEKSVWGSAPEKAASFGSVSESRKLSDAPLQHFMNFSDVQQEIPDAVAPPLQDSSTKLDDHLLLLAKKKKKRAMFSSCDDDLMRSEPISAKTEIRVAEPLYMHASYPRAALLEEDEESRSISLSSLSRYKAELSSSTIEPQSLSSSGFDGGLFGVRGASQSSAGSVSLGVGAPSTVVSTPAFGSSSDYSNICHFQSDDVTPAFELYKPPGNAARSLGFGVSASLTGSAPTQQFPQAFAAPAGGFGFGSSAPPTVGAPARGFGAPSTVAAPAGGFGFGSSAPLTVGAPAGGFGFGSSAPPTVGAPAGVFGFGAPSTVAAPAGGFGFGSSAPSTVAAPAGGFGFGSSAPPTVGAPAGGFGAPSTVAAPAGGFGFGSGFISQADAAPAGGGFAAGVPLTSGVSAPGFVAPAGGLSSPFYDLSISSASVGVPSLFGAPASDVATIKKFSSAKLHSSDAFATSSFDTSSFGGTLAKDFSELKLASREPSTVPAPSHAVFHAPPPVPKSRLVPADAFVRAASSVPASEINVDDVLERGVRLEELMEKDIVLGSYASPFRSRPPAPPQDVTTGLTIHKSKKYASYSPLSPSYSPSSPSYVPASPSYIATASKRVEFKPQSVSVTSHSISWGKGAEVEVQPPEESSLPPPKELALRCKSQMRSLSAMIPQRVVNHCYSRPQPPPPPPGSTNMNDEPLPPPCAPPPPPPPIPASLSHEPLQPPSAPAPPLSLLQTIRGGGGSGQKMSMSRSRSGRPSRNLFSMSMVPCLDTVSQLLVPVRLSIGIETRGGVMTPIFKYNTPLPATETKRLTTCADYQTSVRIKVYEGEYPRTNNNHLLGQMELARILPTLRGCAKISATFNIDVQGTLYVKAVDEATGEFETLTVTTNEEKKSESEIKRMIRNAEIMKKRLELSDVIKSYSNWDICIYEESNERTVPDFREDLFTSAGKMHISTGKVSWTESTWEKLLQLYVDQAENDEGYWELNLELGQLLCIDTEKCKKILVENGLNSLGSQAISDVSRLAATFLVFFRICQAQDLEDSLTTKVTSLSAADCKERLDRLIAGEEFDVPDIIHTPLVRAARFSQRIDTKHPLLYSRLNLGRSWPEAAVNLLGKYAGSEIKI